MTDGTGIVYVVDDNPGILESLSALFESADMQTRTFDCPEKLLAVVPLEPGCLILDVRMPTMSGLELYRKVRESHPDLPVLFITAHGQVEAAVQAMKDGAVDFLEKPVCPETLLQRTRAALEQGRRTTVARCHEREIRKRIDQLTDREREVLSLVCEGRTSRRIAEALGISLKTVEVHRSRCLAKLGAKNVAELVQRIASANIRPEELQR